MTVTVQGSESFWQLRPEESQPRNYNTHFHFSLLPDFMNYYCLRPSSLLPNQGQRFIMRRLFWSGGIRRVKKKAVALISGGLDSILAAKVVMDQGFDIIGLYCTSAFSKSYGNEQETHAVKVSRALGIDLRIFDMGQEYIELVRRPAHGYGKNTNPCIDC
jgi:hypothetical protein